MAEMMNATEVARLFAVKRATVGRWARQGRLRGFRTLGGAWRFDAAAVRAAVEATTKR